MSSDPATLVGRALGPYRLERLLGQGGFAWVFVGREADGTPVAVKVLKPRSAGDAQVEARFRNEAETAAKLEHPNIIRIRSVARTGEHVYFAMDLCLDSLEARIARDGPLPEPELARLARDVAQGLGFAHARGVIHRDLTPANILFHSDGHAVLSDFGIARAVTGHVASTGVDMTIGTPHYLSPEQAQGRTLDHRADFYALGVTLYKAASGEVPFVSGDWFELARKHVEETPVPLRKKRPALSKRFERVVMKCLAKHPDDRYRDAAELLRDLAPPGGAGGAGGGPGAEAPEDPGRAAALAARALLALGAPRHRLAWGLIVVGAAVAILLLALFVRLRAGP